MDGQCKQRDGNPKKEPKERIAIKGKVKDMKNAFSGLISKLDMAEERMSKVEAMSRESLKTEKQRKQRQRNCKQISNHCLNHWGFGENSQLKHMVKV